MNVLIVPSWYTPKEGAQLGSFFREQARALKKNGINVIVADVTFQDRNNIFYKENFKLKKFYDEEILTYSYTVPSLGITRCTNIAIKLFEKRLEKVIRKIKQDKIEIDLIHSHSFCFAGIACARIGKKYKIPVVMTEHSSTIISKSLDSKRIKILKEAVENSDFIISVSHALKNAILDYTHTKKKIEVIPNMVNDQFKYVPKIDSSTFTFISIGNLISSKRFDLTIDAFAKEFKMEKNIKLKIIGDGPLREILKNKVKSMGLVEQVDFLGRLSRSNVVNEIQKSDIFVLPSDFETFGVVYIEALACGKPIIGTINGGAQDIINKENGILINKDNVNQLAHVMKKIFSSYSIYDNEKIANDCKKIFGEKNICSKIIKIYELINKGEK